MGRLNFSAIFRTSFSYLSSKVIEYEHPPLFIRAGVATTFAGMAIARHMVFAQRDAIVMEPIVASMFFTSFLIPLL